MTTRVIARVHLVHVMNVEQRQLLLTLRLSHQTWAVNPPVGCIVYNHHRHLLLLLSTKADTHLPSYRG